MYLQMQYNQQMQDPYMLSQMQQKAFSTQQNQQ